MGGRLTLTYLPTSTPSKIVVLLFAAYHVLRLSPVDDNVTKLARPAPHGSRLPANADCPPFAEHSVSLRISYTVSKFSVLMELKYIIVVHHGGITPHNLGKL